MAAGRDAALADLAAYAQAQKTTGLIVTRDGRTILERNWPLPPGSEAFAAMLVRGTTPDGALLEDVASQQKSMIGLLIGIALDRGLIDIGRTVTSYIGEGWTKCAPEQERAITVRHLLAMTSGLTEALAFECEPGTRFFYNTPVYARLQLVIEVASGVALDVLTRNWLTGPLGMSNTEWKARPADLARTSGNAWGLVTAPRDLAALGRMILEGGAASTGHRVISKEQLAETFAATATNPAYGRLWWLNSGAWSVDVSGVRHDGPLVPSAPSDLVIAAGAQGRLLGVVPSLGLIAVRLGQQPSDAEFRNRFWQHVIASTAD